MHTVLLVIGVASTIIGIGLVVSWRNKRKEYDDRIATIAGAMLSGGDPFRAAARASRSGKSCDKPDLGLRRSGIILLMIGGILILLGVIIK